MSARMLAALLAAALSGFAPVPLPKPKKPEAAKGLAAMQGLWEAVTIERHGSAPVKYPRKTFVTIEADTWTFRSETDGRRPPGTPTYKAVVDAAGKPGTLDLVRPAPAGRGGAFAQVQGIYKLEGDTLLFAYGVAGLEPGAGGRPEGFKPANSMQMIMTLKRVAGPKKEGRK